MSYPTSLVWARQGPDQQIDLLIKTIADVLPPMPPTLQANIAGQHFADHTRGGRRMGAFRSNLVRKRHRHMIWRDMASCVDTNPEIFFPHAGNPRGYVTKASKGRALAVCAGCRVTTECLAYALSMTVAADFGIWGGTTAGQRAEIRHRSRAA